MKQEFLSKSGLVIYDEELKQYLEERFGDDISEALSDVNSGDPIYIWIGTKEEYNAIETKLENCLYILTDDTESVEFENTSNKTTSITADSTDQQYASAKAIWSALQNISGYEKTSNKVTIISNASTDEGYTSPLSVYTLVQNEVNAAKTTVLQTVEDRVLNVEKTTNKTTVVNENSKHTEYPSARATHEAIQNALENFDVGSDIETVDTIDENSTNETVPNSKAVYDFVINHTPELPDTIPTVHTSSEEPTDEDGKVGDIWFII